MDNLWPLDIATSDQETTPLAILKTQAEFLGQRTKNQILAEVQPLEAGENQNDFIYSFQIYAPTLGFYRYEVFKIKYNIEMYPVKFSLDDTIAKELDLDQYYYFEIEVKSEKDFVTLLTKIFSSQKVRRVVSNLLAQVSTIASFDTAQTMDNMSSSETW